jgi:putative ABC transport system substrate-binding protein
MRRRDFMAAFGSAAILPIAARAQQAAPVIGFLTTLTAGDRPHLLEAFRQGLGETGYIDQRSVTIDYRFASNQVDRVRPMAAELVARKVDVIAATGGNITAQIAKTLTSTIPIVFTSGADPVQAGLVTTLNHPEANVTGISWFATELGQKHTGLLRDLLPRAELAAVLVDPNVSEAELYEKSVQEGARAVGLRVTVLKAGTLAEIDAAFSKIGELRPNAVLIASGPFFTARARQIAVLAARHAVPLISTVREMSEAGGLLSYGNNIADAYRRAGAYCGRLLKGAKPADLPVDRATKFELVINLGTAKALGLSVPQTMQIAADEVIE